MGGTQPSLTPKMSCITKPNTKIGTAMTSSDTTSIVESKIPPLREARDRAGRDAEDRLDDQRHQRQLERDGEGSLMSSETGCPENV